MRARTYWGLGLMGIGAVMLLDNFGVVDVKPGFWWPALVFLFSLRMLMLRLAYREMGWFSAAILLLLLAWSGLSLAYHLGFSALQGQVVWQYAWPLLLVALGLGLLLHRPAYGRWWCGRGRGWWQDRIGMAGDVRYGSRPWVFEDLEITHGVGDVAVDLTTATIAPGDHRLTIRAAVGDVQVWVPADVDVEASATALIGDIHLLGEYRSGIPSRVQVHDPAPRPGPERKRVFIQVELFTGDIKVQRVGG